MDGGKSFLNHNDYNYSLAVICGKLLVLILAEIFHGMIKEKSIKFSNALCLLNTQSIFFIKNELQFSHFTNH